VADPLDLSSRVALVTGAARGLGRAEAVALARRGAAVVVADVLDAGAAVRTIRDAGGEAVEVTVDLSESSAAQKLVEVALEAFGDLHILVNNAGLVRDRMSFNMARQEWDAVLAVNLSASFFVAQSVVQYWRQAHDDLDAPWRGVIVNTSSESGLYGNAGQANYAAAKGAVAALTLTLAAELDRYGIRVNAIAPRARTPMSAEAFGELPRGETFDVFAPEHVADVVAWLVSDAAREVSGQVFVVHGGGVEVMRPWSSRRRLERRGRWRDDELRSLRDELFPDGATRHLAPAVGRLFTSSPDRKEAVT
jgi:3-oxoacyl-[acyl-carrier protein] reductase